MATSTAAQGAASTATIVVRNGREYRLTVLPTVRPQSVESDPYRHVRDEYDGTDEPVLDTLALVSVGAAWDDVPE